MRNRIISSLAMAALVVSIGVGTATNASAANQCTRVGGIGNYCGYYTGNAETEEWSTNTAAVKEIQDLINTDTNYVEAGGTALAVDGSFGPATKAAVRWFQNWAQIHVDGNVGPQTWGALRGNG
ncbi:MULTISPECIES: peptidoglycan-binding protein [Streptacidiphilus]|uniref:Peptidoglycan-binding protein n=2 Tax=Streptacidiphilus TaxID=228398 RepID=A0ABV6UZR4_9ACTN|nr:peptidoglycan-binding domain-containing protein [Streptacidiphilus jeojiense]